MNRPAFEAFIAPARAYPQLWRLFLGLILAIAVYLSFVAVLFIALYFGLGEANTSYWVDRISSAGSPTATLLLLTTFLGMGLGPTVAARALHKRGIGSLFGDGSRLWRDFAISAAVIFGLSAISIFIWLQSNTPEPNLNLTLWLRFLPLAILGILVQTGAEELLFRGYLQQQLGARFATPLVWLVIPSIAFGLVHLDPAGAGENAWIVVAAAAVFGLIAADLTAVTGSLGAAWGFHFANNTVAILFLATKGAIPGLALYTTPYAIDNAAVIRTLVIGDLVLLGLAWLILRRILRR